MKAPLMILCSFLCVSQLFSQSFSLNLLDFESSSATDSVLVFGNYHLDGMQQMVVTNPHKNKINNSERVVNYTKSHNASLQAGFSVEIDELYLQHQPCQVCFDYYAPTIGTCRFQMLNEDGEVNATMITRNRKINQWETICATLLYEGPKDISSPSAKTTNRSFVLFPDDGSWGNGEEQEFYFDNLRLYMGDFLKRVNFAVDMNGYEGEYEQVYVSGNFNSWSGNTDTLYDTDKDGIWEMEKLLLDEEIEYVFTMDGWKDKESFSGNELCIASYPDGLGGYYRNRVANISRAVSLPLVCYGSCYSCGSAAEITWNLNMNQETVSPEGVYLAGGDHFGHGKYEMTDADGDGVYSITMERHKGFTSNYTFINGLCSGGWSCKEDIEGQACADSNHYNDRLLPAVTENIVLDACFGYCSSEGLCEVELQYKVTFNLDARGLDIDETIYLAGNTINGWAPHLHPMTDDDNDGIYSITVGLGSGEHLYKFVHGSNWEDLSDETDCTITDPSGAYTNRYVLVEDGEMVLTAVLFEECNGYVSTEEVLSEVTIATVYPTMTSDFMNISFSEKGLTSLVHIYSMNGQLMTEQSFDTSYDHQLDVSAYVSGNYLMTIYNGKTFDSIRFVKI